MTQAGAAILGNGRPELAPQAGSTFPSTLGNDEDRDFGSLSTYCVPSTALAHCGDLQNNPGGQSRHLQFHTEKQTHREVRGLAQGMGFGPRDLAPDPHS